MTCAHELGHGLFQLEHTFSKVYGGVLPQGSTRNLMDYGGGSDLAKWQWDYLYAPGIVIRLFEKDKDAMLRGVFYDGIALTPLVDYKFHYNFGDIYSVESRNGELSCGRYNLTAHYNVDRDSVKKLSYYQAWCEILEDGKKQNRNDYYIGANRLKEFRSNINRYESAADVFFLRGTPPPEMLQVLCGLEISDLSEVLGGLGDMWGNALSDPMWWIDIVNGSVSPKFLKPAGKFMYGFVKDLGVGSIKLLDKCGKLGYKIKHVAGEVALYSNLEIEIARFDSRGILRPLHWGEAIGEKVLSFEDDILFLKNGKELSGKLSLYRSGNNYFWKVREATFTINQINEYVEFATKNKHATKVILGKYDNGNITSYIKRAGKDYTYFDLGNEWENIKKIVNDSNDEMWKINKKFIDEQKYLGKEFYFSHEPWVTRTHEFLSKEAEYLIDIGAKDFRKINDNTWKVIW